MHYMEAAGQGYGEGRMRFGIRSIDRKGRGGSGRALTKG